MKKIMFCVALLVSCVISLKAESFKDLVGNVKVGKVESLNEIQVPYIVWGGDVATFHANGGLATKKDSIFAKQGLNLKMVPGDDFPEQVKDYISGKSPFLRGTFRMIGMASEVIGQNSGTKGVMLFQMTWSAGDHAVSRQEIKTIKDLKGATVCLQKGGPHEGLLDDLLSDAGLSWKDVKVVWAKDLTGTKNSPAAMFRSNSKIDVCFVISPDMLGLTSGLQSVGSGVEGTIKGARVLASTADRSRSIADVYVVRKDFYDANKEWCEKFAAGYLKACEEVIELKKDYESKGSKPFVQLLQMTQNIYGKEVLPTLEEDAYGLILDCAYVGYPGNIKFFKGVNNITGFDALQKSSLDLAQSRGYAKARAGLLPSPLNWSGSAFVGYLSKTDGAEGERFRPEAVVSEIEALNQGGELDDNTIYQFSINFKPNQQEFSMDQYGVEFQKVIELTAKYGNSVIAVRGHSDPTKILLEMVKSGTSKGILKRTGSPGNYAYYHKGKKLDLQNTPKLVREIESGAFDGAAGTNPRETMQAALNLSRKRAEAVKNTVVALAQKKNLELDSSQIQPMGVGIADPIIPKPTNMSEAETNMRVEFRLIRVRAEVMNDSDFNF